MREQLELSDEQVKKLETLQSTARPQLNQADMLRAQADLMDATKGDVNVEKARGAYERMARLRTDVQVSQLKMQQDARNVLTPGQRTKADAMRVSMRDGRGADMRNGRMKQGGMRNGAFRKGGLRQGNSRGPGGPGAGGGREDRNGGPPAMDRFHRDGRDLLVPRRRGSEIDTQPTSPSDTVSR